jgi:hypothetical protein
MHERTSTLGSLGSVGRDTLDEFSPRSHNNQNTCRRQSTKGIARIPPLFLVALQNASFCHYSSWKELESFVKIAIIEPRTSSREHIRMLAGARSKYQRNGEVPIGFE